MRLSKDRLWSFTVDTSDEAFLTAVQSMIRFEGEVIERMRRMAVFKEFNLGELQPLMMIENRNGERYILNDYDENLVGVSDHKTFTVIDSCYKESLDSTVNFGRDIIKVYSRGTRPALLLSFDPDDRVLLWKRQEVKEVTMAEVCEKFGYDVKIVEG